MVLALFDLRMVISGNQRCPSPCTDLVLRHPKSVRVGIYWTGSYPRWGSVPGKPADMLTMHMHLTSTHAHSVAPHAADISAFRIRVRNDDYRPYIPPTDPNVHGRNGAYPLST